MEFKELLKKISPTLKRITYRFNGHFSYFNDEDLYQEAVVHLWQDFQRGKLQDKTDSYILQGCYFHLKNYLRKASVKIKSVSIETSVTEDGLSLGDTLLFEYGPGDYRAWLNDKLLAESIRNNGLTLREKQILEFYADGLTTREIGRRLGISHVRVIKLKNIIQAKYKKLKEEF